jgi:excinuclease UvrABC nuclease subunit
MGDKELGWKTETNIKFAQGKPGVYIIKKNGKIVYIGSGNNVYKTALRHFEPHKPDHYNKQEYYKDYEKNDYTIRVVLTNTRQQANTLEMALIRKHKPVDNKLQYDMILDYVNNKKQNAILEEYLDAPF